MKPVEPATSERGAVGEDATSGHATCIVLGEDGILIRGPSGSGKSTLARSLLDRAETTGLFARLVSDDRVRLEKRAGRVVARVEPTIAGLIEMRGLGLLATAYEAAARLRLVVDCGGDPPRFPEESVLWTDILGVRLARMTVAAGIDAADLVLWRWRALRDTPVTGS